MKTIVYTLFLVLLPLSLLAQYVNPESAIWDDANKRYYITNAGSGSITMRDWSGKTNPSWVSGMIQPKAMLLIDDVLYVVDYTTIKTYDTKTQRLIKNETVPGATFLNDICMDDYGNFYITDTYDNSIIKYDVELKKYSKLPLKGFIEKPNGIIFDGDRLIIVSFRPNSPIQAISLSDYTVTNLRETDIGYMDGIVKDGKGNIFISAWIDQNPGSGKVYKIKEDFTGDFEVVVSNLDGPADIYYNQLSDTLVIPVMNGNYVQFLSFIEPPPAPKLLEPASGSYFKQINEIKWEEARAATSYRVQVANNSSFDSPEFDVDDITNTFLIFEFKDVRCDTLWWRIKAMNSEGESPWSEAWYMLPPSAIEPVLIYPPDEAVDIPIEFDFLWRKQFQNYRILIDTVPEFGDGSDLVEFDTKDTSYTIKGILQPEVKYYWTVKGVYCDDEISGPVWSFTTMDNRPPGKPVLVQPDDKDTDLDPLSIEFIWNKSDRADYYIFYLMLDQYYKIIVIQDTIKSEGEEMEQYLYGLSNLDYGTEYFWAVHALNNYGITESDVFSFTTRSATGVDDDNTVIKLIPNPANSWAKIQLPKSFDGAVDVALYNTKGVSMDIDYEVSSDIIVLRNLNRLSPGAYILKLTHGDELVVRKLIVE
jgi:hypothetical protein